MLALLMLGPPTGVRRIRASEGAAHRLAARRDPDCQRAPQGTRPREPTPATPATPEATETDETVAGDDTVGDGENDARDRARERADDVLAKRDAEAERRQPE